MRKPKPKSKRKPGAQAGNKNALRHGFYAKTFTADENDRLDAQKRDVTAEINLVRVYISRLCPEISFDEITRTDNNGAQYRDAHYLSQLNTLSMLTATIATLERTDYLMRGRNESVQASILQALEIVRLELGIA